MSSSRADVLLPLADDELVVGWRDSEWTGIAPFLEEDVAFSSIAQNEIGHARVLYELVADELGTDADALAFDRPPSEFRCAPFVQLRLVPDWGRTVARHYLYEAADAIRIAALKSSADETVAGLAAKIEREEAYHLMHAEMWIDRLREEQRVQDALAELWPYAVAMLEPDLRPALAARVGRQLPGDNLLHGLERGVALPELTELFEEMTMVRRLAPAGQW